MKNHNDLIIMLAVILALSILAVVIRSSWHHVLAAPTSQSFYKMIPVELEPVCYQLTCQTVKKGS